MDKRVIKQLLLSSNYWSLNKEVVYLLGLETAFFLTNLAEAENMMADDDGWFYQTAETLETISTLNRYKQDKCIEELERFGILQKEVKGLPPRRYFKLNYHTFANLFVKFSQIELQNLNKSICENLTTNKESIDKENKYKNNSNNIIILTELEAQFIQTLESIQGYPTDRVKDVEYMKLMQERYPTLDLIQAIRKWAIYIMDNPFKKNANYRSQMNTSFGKYVEWGHCLKGGSVAKKATVDRVGVPDHILQQDEKYHTKNVNTYTAAETDAEIEVKLERIRKLEERIDEK